MRPAILFLLLLAIPAYARMDETVQEIQNRYGKPRKGVKAEYPATVAGTYEKNGFGIIVGFYQGKSYYEQFWKIDPSKKSPALQASEEEREVLLKANCLGCNWTGHTVVTTALPWGDANDTVTTYDRSDGLAKATYSDKTKLLIIRSLVVEKQDEENRRKKEADEKQRQLEKLKGF